jgi:radical SAM-linked protein
MNIRLKFTKGNEVKYISHLDLMRVFQRAIRRTGIPIAYSSGFNPHQEISFGAPLSLGVTSNAEYIDLKLADAMDVQEIKERLNSSLPDGIRILGGMKLRDSHKSAMSVVTHARYRISMNIENVNSEKLQKSIEAFLIQEHIKVMKEQPKKNFALKEIDIKPMIVSMNPVKPEGNTIIIECLLLSGSRGNLKPELLMSAFKDFTDYNITGIRINREEVYAEKDGMLVDLLEYES